MKADVSRTIFLGVVLATMVGGSFAAGLHAGTTRNVLFRAVNAVKANVAESVATLIGEASTLSGTKPTHLIQPSRDARDGVTVNDASRNQDDLILLAGFFKDTNELRLVRRNGTVLARWPVKYHDLFPNPGEFRYGVVPATDWNIDTHGSLALPDGSVIFSFEYGGLTKLDRCGQVIWTVRRPTHHSVELAEDGGFLVPSRKKVLDGESPYPPFPVPLDEDTILKISDDGRVVNEFPVVKTIYENRLEALLTTSEGDFLAPLVWDEEIIHLNKVTELKHADAGRFPAFEAGDLLLSMRDLNLLMVVDKTVKKVKWWQIGPWVRQHDPEFTSDGHLLMFNNNAYENLFPAGRRYYSPASSPRVSTIMEADPQTRATHIRYGGKPEQELLSIVKGKVDAVDGGGLLITEFEGGRVIETDAAGKIVWEYINHYSPEEVGEISEARLYPSTYFKVSDWSCSPAGK
jgi:hypothetical protein